MEITDFKQKVEAYLLDDPNNQDVKNIDLDTHLWDNGLVDSFRMVGLITFLEDLLDLEINIESNFITNFHTIGRMYNTVVPK